MTPEEYLTYDALALAELVRTKKASPRELLDASLAVIDRHDPKVNAVIHRLDEAARAQTENVGDGAFAGVPFLVKDLDGTLANAPWNAGSRSLKGYIAPNDSALIARYRRAGLVFVGKTNTPEFGLLAVTEPELHGATRNPWNLDHVPGGSSGGSAAALAAGLTGVEAGSDIGSSIRNPAHYCGVFGLKPTYGIIPLRRHSLPNAFAPTDISVTGPLTRGAADLDVMLDVMAGPDELDEACWKLDLPHCGARSLKDLRIAVKLRDPNSEVDAEYADRLQALVDALAKRGATVKEIEPAIDTRRLHELYVLLLRAATSGRTPAADIARWKTSLAELGADKEPYLARMIRGVEMSHRDWIGLNNERHKLRFAFDAFFKDWDILLCPAAASAAWPHDQKGERWQRKIEVNGRKVATTDQLFWAGYSGVIYLPSTIGPAGLTARSKLPVGYQAIARHGHDRTAIAFSRLVEAEIGGFVPPPGYE